MELDVIEDGRTRLPTLDGIADLAGGGDNWTMSTSTAMNLTRLAADITNYSLNLMDVGVTSSSTTSMPARFAEAALAAIVANATTLSHQLSSAIDPLPVEDDEIRLEHAPQFSKSALIKVYVLSLMALLSLLGNILTMWNIYKTRIARRNSRHSWSAIYSLIFHLSIADVLVSGFCIIGEAAWSYTVQWIADELTCKLVKLFQMFSLYLSTYVLVLIGVDRWIAVKYPMKSLNMAKRCYRLLGGTYILSFLLSLPQFFVFRVARGPFIEEFHQCVTYGVYTAEWQEQLYGTFTLVFTFLLPLCILFGTYLSTFRTISNSEKMFQGSKLAAYSSKPTTQTNRQRLIHKAKMKSLRISVVIIFAFLICWTPYNVMMIIFMFWNPDKRFGEDLQSAIFVFGMSNSLVNPLIYGAFHLCPMKRKTGKNGNNNNATHSLNRGDSHRTPSMLTAVTQIDNNGRQVRTYRQPSYYRTNSNNSSSNCKEHVSLLQITPTSTLLRKSSSIRSPHPKHSALVVSNPPVMMTAKHLMGNGAGSGDIGGGDAAVQCNPQSTVVLSYNGGHSNRRTTPSTTATATSTSTSTHRNGSSSSLNGNSTVASQLLVGGKSSMIAGDVIGGVALGLHALTIANENVSSV